MQTTMNITHKHSYFPVKHRTLDHRVLIFYHMFIIIIIISHELSIYYMPLSGFTQVSCYTWDYVTSIRERHYSSSRYFLFLCLWINVATILLCSQSPKPIVILTQSCAFNTDLSH